MTGPAAPRVVRVCTALSTTQLLPLIHILRHKPEADGRDILLWDTHIMGAAAEEAAGLMREVASSYPFHAVHRTSDFALLGLPGVRRAARPLAFVAYNWADCRRLRRLLAPHRAPGARLEVWTDEPYHFPVQFVHAALPRAAHVKVPHAFNHEDVNAAPARQLLLGERLRVATPARRALWAVTRAVTGVAYTAQTALTFDRGFTFEGPSPWAPESESLRDTVTRANLQALFEALPASLRAGLQGEIAAAAAGDPRPWALLLLFAIGSEPSKDVYRRAVNRLASRRPGVLAGRRLVLKPHPLGRRDLPRQLRQELEGDLGTPVGLLDCRLNLEVLWHLMPLRVLLAGPCGALPLAHRLGVAECLVLREFLEPPAPALTAREREWVELARRSVAYLPEV